MISVHMTPYADGRCLYDMCTCVYIQAVKQAAHKIKVSRAVHAAAALHPTLSHAELRQKASVLYRG